MPTAPARPPSSGCLNSTVTPSAGRALLGGRDGSKDPIGTRTISSVVFQDAVADQPLTGRQNLELHLKLWGAGPQKAGPG